MTHEAQGALAPGPLHAGLKPPHVTDPFREPLGQGDPARLAAQDPRGGLVERIVGAHALPLQSLPLPLQGMPQQGREQECGGHRQVAGHPAVCVLEDVGQEGMGEMPLFLG